MINCLIIILFETHRQTFEEFKRQSSHADKTHRDATIKFESRAGWTQRQCGRGLARAARSHWPARRRCHMMKLRGMTGRRIADFATWRRSEGEVAGAVPSENVSFLVARSSDPVVTSQSRATVEIRVRVAGCRSCTRRV